MNLKTVSSASHEIDSKAVVEKQVVVQVPTEPIKVDYELSPTPVPSEAFAE
jgi:hypothetical protein